MIRHSGRALIRGKIRRVWRPRFLQLCDNGLVRYYECTPEQNILKCTLVIYSARIIDVTTLRDVHVGLPMGMFGFVFHGKRYTSNDYNMECTAETVQPRDFLCAVTTLEEAQCWVVALNWAVQRKRRLEEEEWHDLDDSQQQQHAFQVVSNKTAKTSKTVVTKVTSLQVVRTDTWKFQLAYSIRLLLLKTQPNRNSCVVQEYVLLRTLDDLHEMLATLETQASNGASRRVLGEIKLPHSLKLYSDYVASMPLVDRALQALAMDASLCNAPAMRSFYSLNSNTATTTMDSRNVPFLLQLHKSHSVVEQRQWTCLQNPKDFVQKWLQEGSSKQQCIPKIEILMKTVGVWLLQQPAAIAGGLASIVLLLPPLIRVYRTCMVSASIRVDVLVLSWIAAVYIGRDYEKRRAKWTRSTTTTSVASPARQEQVEQPSRPTTTTDMTHEQVEEEEEEGDETMSLVDVHSVTSEEGDESVLDEQEGGVLSSPLPQHPANGGISCWSIPDHDIFRVRGASYLQDRVKIPSAAAPFCCRGVDIWLTDNPERHISRHPAVLGGKLGDHDTFVVNFLLPFGNFVAYFGIPPMDKFPSKLGNVWTKFINGDQQYRDARLKLLPLVIDGPWIVKAAVPGTSPALLGKVIPLQYYFQSPSQDKKGVYEVDAIITASRIAKGILSVVKGHTKMLTMAFAFIIEAAEEAELPETVLCTFQMHSIHLEDCPQLPECNLDEMTV